MRVTARNLHKWIAIGIGVVFALWVVSGVVMMIPYSPALSRRLGPPDFTGATVTPAQAVALLASRDSVSRAVRAVALVRVGTRPVYQLIIEGGESHLIDAGSGASVRITAELAGQVVREEFGAELPVARVEPVGERSAGHPAAFRVVLNDPAKTWIQVSTRDGALIVNTARSRFRNLMGGLHTFGPVRRIYDSERAQLWLIYTTSAASIVIILTGYWLALPRRFLRKKTGN